MNTTTNPFRRKMQGHYSHPTSPTETASSVPLQNFSLKSESVVVQVVEDGGSSSSSASVSRGSGIATSASGSSSSPSFSSAQRQQQSESISSTLAAPTPPAAQSRQHMFARYDSSSYDSGMSSGDSTTLVNSSMPTSQPATEVPPAEVDVALGPNTVPASVINFPEDALNPRIQYSTRDELVSLWDAANGERLREPLGKFNLRMERINIETFTFGDPQLPFYTLQVHADSLLLTRTHPHQSNRSVRAMMLTLEDPARRQPPHDGLVTNIFSNLAATLAVEQAAELARQHNLAPTDALEVQENAVNRAAAQESCRLLWDARNGRYELHHPSLLQQHSPLPVGEDGNPLPRVQIAKPGILHISVSQTLDSNDGPQPPAIVVTSPAVPNAVEAANATANPHLSIVPQTADTDEPLATLDLGTMTLSLCASATTTIIPSLYAIDSLIAAVLAVGVSDAVTRQVLIDTEIYIPGQETPRTPMRRTVQTSSTPRVSTWSGSTVAPSPRTGFSGKLVATLAEREEAEQEAKLMAQLCAADKKDRRKRSKKKSASPRSSSGKTKSKGNNKVVVEEFDYEANLPEEHKIPGVVRAMGSVVACGLKAVVAVVKGMLKCAVWVMVRAAK
ncbi:hypothetical protein VTN31DRAFT_1251 [Thermomyces dupontii]|uniref:uncharacterized protein n=1 Tax=Talaromyces thermophilus TaxID=28565 RepID=UPI0037447DE0